MPSQNITKWYHIPLPSPLMPIPDLPYQNLASLLQTPNNIIISINIKRQRRIDRLTFTDMQFASCGRNRGVYRWQCTAGSFAYAVQVELSMRCHGVDYSLSRVAVGEQTSPSVASHTCEEALRSGRIRSRAVRGIEGWLDRWVCLCAAGGGLRDDIVYPPLALSSSGFSRRLL